MKRDNANDLKWQETLKYANGDYKILGVEYVREKHEVFYDDEESLNDLTYDDVWKWNERPTAAQWYEEKLEDYKAKVNKGVKGWGEIKVTPFRYSFTGKIPGDIQGVEILDTHIEKALRGDDWDSSKKYVYQWFFIPKNSKYNVATEGQRIIKKLNPIYKNWYNE